MKEDWPNGYGCPAFILTERGKVYLVLFSFVSRLLLLNLLNYWTINICSTPGENAWPKCLTCKLDWTPVCLSEHLIRVNISKSFAECLRSVTFASASLNLLQNISGVGCVMAVKSFDNETRPLRNICKARQCFCNISETRSIQNIGAVKPFGRIPARHVDRVASAPLNPLVAYQRSMLIVLRWLR